MDILNPATGKLPTLRTIEDVRGHTSLEDLEALVDLGALYTFAIDNSNDEHIKRMGVFHPSAVGYCKRSSVLQYIRVMPTDRKSKKLQEIFATGHLYHALVQNKLHKLHQIVLSRGINYEFTEEVPYDRATDQLFLEFGIGGTTDGILRFWTSEWEQRGIFEFKSQNDDRHKTLLSMKLGYSSHLQQSHLYAWRFNCPIIWVWYINKNDSSRAIRPMLFDHAIFDVALNYFSDCGSYVARGELPPREESWFECSECSYRTMCEPACLRGKSNRNSIPAAKLLRKNK